MPRATSLQRKSISAARAVTCLCLVWLCLTGLGCSAKEDEIPQKVVARVNGEVILQDDLDREIARVDRSFSIQPSRFDTRKLSGEVLHEMIRKRLLLIEARRIGISLSPDQVRSAVSAQRGEISKEDFEKILEKAGVAYPEWEQQIVNDRLIELLIHNVIDPKIRITEDELSAYYRDHPEEFKVPERVKVRQIVLANKEEAAKVRERLTDGKENFELVAQEVSLSPDAAQGGEIGVFSKGKMPPEFDEVCFSLQIGEISPVVKSPYGYHIFLVEEHLPAGTLSFKEARKTIYDNLFAEGREKTFAAYQNELWNKAEITISLDKG
jgi:peptidyl-prolyl cis-trans isomerase C